MGREIKYRAWDELEKRMWTLEDAGEDSGDGSIQYFSENGSLEFGRLEFYDIGLGINSNFTKFPLMQYTGLKDKNGKEIYEGDILSISDREGDNQVVYFAEGFYCTDEFALFELTRSKTRTFEVIGNIYENPELLEETA